MLSIIVPSIRPQNWRSLWKSVEDAKIGSYEIIFVGPMDQPKYMDFFASIANVKFVRDFGNPVRASQIGATLAEGKYITWAADDGVYLSNNLRCFYQAKKDDPEIDVLVAPYYEGKDQVDHGFEYYRLNGSEWTSSPKFEDSWWLYNVGIMKLELFQHLGGWDSRMFETTFYAHSDMAARSQFLGHEVSFYNCPVLHCSHQPDTTGDHAPIHHAHMGHDYELFKKVWSDGNYVRKKIIDLDNWKKSSKVWERRFTNVSL